MNNDIILFSIFYREVWGSGGMDLVNISLVEIIYVVIVVSDVIIFICIIILF